MFARRDFAISRCVYTSRNFLARLMGEALARDYTTKQTVKQTREARRQRQRSLGSEFLIRIETLNQLKCLIIVTIRC
ncbi:hypothetical protein GE061_000394 [Apolygus lucorum]|uniref:Uncharacterized protein n=1 Tax=Apolygus lucorum TaxID=248454 RepID=A0A8S9Y6X6_APOLU|nr:hypothetical protein GE061_000394 [Apolygus lucorum]